MEDDRYAYSSVVSDRALREIYLMPFMIAEKNAKPWAIMTSYVFTVSRIPTLPYLHTVITASTAPTCLRTLSSTLSSVPRPTGTSKKQPSPQIGEACTAVQRV